MSNRSVTLLGTLIGGVVGPGGETTGYVLQLRDIDVDLSALERPGLVSGNEYLVAGDFHERVFPLRGRVKVLYARALVPSPGGLSRDDLRASVFLRGVVRTDIIRPGGETTGALLVGAAPQIDLSKVKNTNLVGKEVLAAGSFALVSYPLLGLQFVFRTSALHAVPLRPVQPRLVEASRQAGTTPIEATGFSDKFSLEEALLDAVRQLPAVDVADALLEVHVASIDAEFGGIAGLSRLKVLITCSQQPPSTEDSASARSK